MQPRKRVSCGLQVLRDPEQVLAVARFAYVAINAAGRVIAWNPAAERVFGFPGDEACGEDLAELVVPLNLRASHRAGLARLAAGEPSAMLGHPVQLVAVHRDGHEFPVELTLTVTEEPGGTVFHAFAQDVTTAQRVSRFAAAEAAVSRGLAEAASSAEAAARVVEALGERMGWQVSELWLADDERGTITCAARHTVPGLRGLESFTLDELDPGVGLPGRVYQQAAAGWIPDLAADTRSFRSRAAAHAGLHVAIGVPVISAGHTLGALCVYGDRVEDPEETVTALLGGIAAQVGVYLERRRAEELTVELARTKDEFLALVTHEVRNPLSVITGAAGLLVEDLDTLSPDEHREQLQVILRSAQRLGVIADDLLDLARLESGHITLLPTGTDLAVIIREAASALTPAAREKQLTITLRVPESLPLHADPDRIRQVADNLLSNAIKYTPAGGVITVDAERSAGRIVWTVSDTGIGIPAAERPYLFRRFYRASTAVDRRIPGTGLGLVIIRTIVERHHGTIALTDTTGPGTTFTIHLPTTPPP
ncbi:ATP-binding protein [Actinoplanes sp. NPDC051851]|uniref:sensor histidine kinase n=1 Tax=Actinoplanes sp. NPDC051851 TaxID=3154753 RepID=UPI003418133F